ncbi:cyclin-P isoform X2 [Mauremys reevesii]|uniref:cyclin-P isoform X2 n=1 Tax=Mauremys reevesii TaxID=260615 RepID=UPI00193FFF10|nr:cyclin-P isoform X2 [Mauremys reevesii]
MMCAALGPPPNYHERRAWAPPQRPLQAEERREPLKSKNKGPGGDKGARKKKPQGSRVREAAPEKAAAVCSRIPATPVLQRGGLPGGAQALLCLPEALAEELRQALVGLGMALEQDYAWDIFTSLMRKQSSYVFRSWEVPRALTAEMRALIVDWLVQVHVGIGVPGPGGRDAVPGCVPDECLHEGGASAGPGPAAAGHHLPLPGLQSGGVHRPRAGRALFHGRGLVQPPGAAAHGAQGAVPPQLPAGLHQPPAPAAAAGRPGPLGPAGPSPGHVLPGAVSDGGGLCGLRAGPAGRGCPGPGAAGAAGGGCRGLGRRAGGLHAALPVQRRGARCCTSPHGQGRAPGRRLHPPGCFPEILAAPEAGGQHQSGHRRLRLPRPLPEPGALSPAGTGLGVSTAALLGGALCPPPAREGGRAAGGQMDRDGERGAQGDASFL